MASGNNVITTHDLNLVKLESRVDQHDDVLQNHQELLNFLEQEVTKSRNIHADTNLILAKLTIVLENTNKTLEEHKKTDEVALDTLQKLSTRTTKIEVKQAIIIGVFIAIGSGLVTLALKHLQFIGG